MEGSSGCVGFNVWLRMGWVYSDKVTGGCSRTRCPPPTLLGIQSYQPAIARVPATQAPDEGLEASLYSSEEGPMSAPAPEAEEEERHLCTL